MIKYGKAKYMKEYLETLTLLCKSPVVKTDLLSCQETYTFLEMLKKKHMSEKIIFKSLFKNKDLKIIFDVLSSIHENECCYLTTHLSKYCGIFILNNLNDFNSNFEYSDDKYGFITIYTPNGSNCLILDFYDEQNEQFLNIEICGKDWMNAAKSLI